MESKKIFDDFYATHSEKHFSRGLLQFFETVLRDRVNHAEKILDLGCGNYSFFEEVKNLNAVVTAVDFSQRAINQAPKSNIIYQVKSLSEKNIFPKGEFDLIMDSHCMNCLVQDKDRTTAYENIFRALKRDAIFASEMMVRPVDKNIAIPFKRIKTARELEEEILSNKLKIIYFMITKDSFVNVVNGEEIICDVLRVIAKKESA